MISPARFLDVTGDLSVTAAAGELRVRGVGDEILVEIPGLTSGAKFLGVRPGRRAPLSLGRIDEALRNAGLGVTVTLKKRRVGRLGKGAHPRLLDRLAGMYPMQLHYGAIFRSFFAGASTPEV